MHDDRRLLEQRITRELAERLPPLVHPEREPLAVHAGTDPQQLSPITVGDRWGAPWSTTWFHLRGKVPTSWRGRSVQALVDLGFEADSPGFQCEGLVLDASGAAIQGIHPRRQAVPVDSTREYVELTVEAASNPAFPQFRPSPMGSLDTAPEAPIYRFRRADLVLVDVASASLLADLDVLDGVMRTLDERDPRRSQLLHGIVAALDVLPDVVAATRHVQPLLAVPARASAHHIVACGHAHIDTAWLWPIRETRRKCRRTFTSAVAMMDADPNYRFVCSQAQHYAWIEEDDPALFERICDHVAGGQFIPVGGMWVESDMNLPSGESIVRQLMFGQRYFESRFGVRCTEVWIPDVFGYPAGLPQVLAAAGISRFVTQKLSWNKTNRLPHHTFWWEGLDGTRVLTHFPPVETYNAEVTPEQLAFASSNFSDHRWTRHSLMPFGYGDGGGGPTTEMLERARRLADLDGMPTIDIGSPADYFDLVDAEIADGAEPPVWRGELYFETHRATLTSQIETKLGNRRCERLLFETELWAAVAGRQADIDDQWREVLTQQFHDILPGSSIAWVHADAEEVFERVASELEARIAELLRDVTPGAAGTHVANAASRARLELVELDDELAGELDEGHAATQPLADGRAAALVAVDGFAVAPLATVETADRVVVTDSSLRNRHLAVRWDPDGTLSSIIDSVRGRELVRQGAAAAVVELAVDHPVEYDAWDVEAWTRAAGVDVGGLVSIDVLDEGPLLGRVSVRRVVGDSTIDVVYRLAAESPRLDIEIDIDWHHDEHLLSIAFPLEVHADTAACDVQFGTVQRPTHRSTSWDAAKFEVCAHRFVAVSEPSFGVAVLNDGRYGHGLFDGAIRVSLARAPKYPDPTADRGHHRVTLALLPFGGDLAEVSAQAELLNRPLRLVPAGAAGSDAAARSFVEVLGAGVDVDAVKLADDGSGDVVVRLHEACGDRVAVTVRAASRIASATRCFLDETSTTALETSDGVVAFTLSPFELVTVRLALVAG